MKKLFEIIGLLSLLCFSFIITEKTSLVVKNTDEIMMKIKEEYHKYKKDSKDATIINNDIIPGIYGREVDINKSYTNMKKYGVYNEDLYVYKDIKPKISITDNLDKFIINGNQENRNVSIIFYTQGNDDISNIIDIVEKNNIKVNYFVDEKWFTKNNDLVLKIINDGHIIGNLSNNLDYNDTSFSWMNTIIKSIGKQKDGYCYYTNSSENLNTCVLLKNYTIKPLEIDENPYLEIKKNLKPGKIFSFKINNQLKKELDTIINYIESKGYNIINIEDLIKEN